MLRTPTRALIAVGSTTALTMSHLSGGTLPTWADPAHAAGDNEHPSSASLELSVLSERETAGESATNDSVRTQGQSAPSVSTTGREVRSSPGIFRPPVQPCALRRATPPC